jgi:ABC-type nickel/cobalt efflux system permease component RcnA
LEQKATLFDSNKTIFTGAVVKRNIKNIARYLGLTLAVFWGVWLMVSPVRAAHPLDEFYQVTFISVGANQSRMIVELYPGVLIAPKVIEAIDANRDDQFSEAEVGAYAAQFIDDITVEVDGQPAPVQVERMEFGQPLEVRAGVGVIRFFLTVAAPPNHRGNHQLFYDNNHAPERAVYIVNALSDDPQWVQINAQDRDLQQKSIRLEYVVAPDAPAPSGEASAAPEVPATPDIQLPTGAPTEAQLWLTGRLREGDLSLGWAGVVLAVSMVLGGIHALTPGHGKTLVAAYLIGSRGTVKHAVALGGIVTFTHTASVIVIGLLALAASSLIVPEILVPALEIASGALVVFIGLQLLWTRWRAYRHGELPHDHHHHDHDHHHNHVHSHKHDHPHDDDHHHHHDIPDQVTLRDLLALGISGGLVPCPEALGIMLIAIGLNRILLGLGMVVSFSFGLAAVLIVIGILLVRARTLLDGVSSAGQRWQTLLPLISAIIVTLLGVGIMLKGLYQ